MKITISQKLLEMIEKDEEIHFKDLDKSYIFDHYLIKHIKPNIPDVTGVVEAVKNFLNPEISDNAIIEHQALNALHDGECLWEWFTEDKDGVFRNGYRTSCGNYINWIDRKFGFCPYCGKRVKLEGPTSDVIKKAKDE